MPNLFEEFRAVVAVLSTARIPYAICGGIAMSIHARPRATTLRGSPQDMADIALLEGPA
jgi:hypothetical protein